MEEYILDHPGSAAASSTAPPANASSPSASQLRSAGIPGHPLPRGPVPPEERSKNQEDFVYDRRRVMVATNAFGMGIDKSNVSFVLHYNMPKNLENYYQEAGRAGRDGEKAECILLFSLGDVQTARYFIDN
ncbi:MAG: helicase-related protein [Subdoligranulum sp.]